jgi:hypothetical protein
MTKRWRAHAHSGARRLWHGGSNCSSGHDATQSYTLWLEAAVRATLEGEAAPRHHAVERLAPCGKKGHPGVCGWPSYAAQGARRQPRRHMRIGTISERCTGPLVASAWPWHCGECSSGVLQHTTMAYSNMRGWVSPQSTASSEGM